MSEQDPKKRVKNFNEVALGYTKEQAIAEAKRCIKCKNPTCIAGCPVEIDIPAFIALIADGDIEGAIRKLKEKNSLPAICGRVCPQEDQCEKVCVLAPKRDSSGLAKKDPIAIGRLERFAADYEIQQLLSKPAATVPAGRQENRGSVSEPRLSVSGSPSKVAIVGSGPAGLTCAADLAKMGYQVTVFESLHETGGVLTYGIPEFRLPKKIVNFEVDGVRKLGVQVMTNVLVGRTITFDELKEEGFKAVFVGSGAGLPQFMGIPGEDLNGVYSANEFLVRINLMKAYLFPEYLTPVKAGKKVAVVGGGNVAMDSARCALRLGADEVTVIYRRSEAEMPARDEEIEHAKEEGIKFRLLTDPIRLIGDNTVPAGRQDWVKQVECLKMELGEPDASGRRRPVPIKGTEFKLDIDVLVMAIGNRPNPLVPSALKGLKTEKWGGVVVNEDGQTSIPYIFAGGDIVTGAATVIEAMGAGKKAARAIDKFLSK